MNDAPVLLPIDRGNLFSWLSRGLVLPRSLMDKYRSDVLERQPEYLLIVDAMNAGAWTSLADHPVVVELAGSVGLDPDAPGNASGISPVRAVVSANRIAKVHVATKADADEISARAFRGFDGGRLRLVVSPELFEHEDSPDRQLEVVVPHRGDADANELATLGRREAIAGGIVSMYDGSPEVWEVARSQAASAPDDDEMTAFLGLLDAAAMFSDATDLTLMRTLLPVLYEQSSNADIVPPELLAEVERRFDTDALPTIHRHFERILHLTRGQEALHPFRPGGLRTTKALLLFLLRPSPEDVRGWADDDLNAETPVLLLSRMLAGFASRFGGLPTAMRDTPITNGLLDWVAASVEPVGVSVEPAVFPPPPVPSPDTFDNVDGLGQSGSIRDAVAEEVASGDAVRAVRIAHALGWEDSVRLSVTAQSVTVRSTGKRVEVSFVGRADVSESVDSSFLDRLHQTDESAIERALADPPASPKRRTSRRKATSRQSKT